MPASRQSAVETVCAYLALCAGVALILLAFGAESRLTHPMWLDECITSLLANDPSFGHALSAIRGGVENNPPTYYLALWPVAHLAGGLSTLGLRLVAGTSMIAALTGIYAICRLYVDRLRAVFGTMAVAAHPMIIAQMFEVRFYGAWLAAMAWFAWAVLSRPATPDSPRRTFRCLAAAVAGTIHWYGVIAVTFIVLADVFFVPGTTAERRRRAIPLACSIAVTLLLSPFLIGQRQGLTVATWIAPTTGLALMRMAYRIFVNPSMIVVVGFVAWRLLGWPRVESASRSRVSHDFLRESAPVLALLLFPIAIVALSLALQPTLVERYLIPVTIPLGLIAGVAAVPASRGVRRFVTVGAIGALTVAMGRELRVYNSRVAVTDRRISNAIAATERIVAQRGPLPVVFARRFEHYPLVQLRPDLASFAALIDFDGIPEPRATDLTLFERDMARRVSHFYPQYLLLNASTLRRIGSFVVVTSSDDEAELRRVLWGFDVSWESPDVYSVSSPGTWLTER